MPARVAAYGFLGRYPGDIHRGRYLMPSNAAAMLRNFRLYALGVWPDDFSGDDLLLSLKVQSKDGVWKERLESPEPLRRYAMPIDFSIVSACVPLKMRSYPGRFYTFVGETPLGWTALINSPEVLTSLQATPNGAVSVGWSGGLRGLLLLGTSG